MQTLTVQAEVDAAGRLKLDVPTNLPKGGVDVVLVVEPRVLLEHAAAPRTFGDLAGRLKWSGDAVAEQRRLRDAW